MCCCSWKSAFSVYNLLLDHPNPSLFGTPQCGRLQWLFIIYRLVFTLFLIGSWIHDMVFDNVYYPIYLTNWSFVLLTLSAILETISAIYHQVNISRSPEGNCDYKSMPVFYKITWVFHNVSNTVNLATSALFWAALYPGSVEPLSYTNIVTHGVNSIYVFINLWTTAIPIRLLHVWHPVTCGVLYTVFSLIYYAAGGVNMHGKPYIYNLIDWGGSPGMATGLVLGVNILVIPIFHFVCFIIYKLRLNICGRCGCTATSHGIPTEELAVGHEKDSKGRENEAFEDIELRT